MEHQQKKESNKNKFRDKAYRKWQIIFKINKAQRCVFLKTQKLIKTLARMIKEKGEKIQLINIKHKKGDYYFGYYRHLNDIKVILLTYVTYSTHYLKNTVYQN